MTPALILWSLGVLVSLAAFAMELLHKRKLWQGKIEGQPGGQNTMDPESRNQINKENSTTTVHALNEPKPVGAIVSWSDTNTDIEI